MIFVALSFIAGIGAFKFFPYFPVSIAASCITLIAVLFFRHKTKRRNLLLLVIIFVSGIVYSSVRENDLQTLSFPSGDLHVVGDIDDIPELSEEQVRFTINKVIVEGQRIEGKVRLSLYKEYLDIPLSDIDLLPGNRISALARLRKPVALRNPGVYSYNMKSRGIVASGYVRQMTVGEGILTPLTRILRVRRKLAAIIEKGLSAESGSLHKALIPGLKTGMAPRMREAFSAAGLSHLLSISGTHFGLLALIFFRSYRKVTLCLPEKVLSKLTLYITPTQASVLCTLPVLGAYAFISGMSTPTVRSLILVLIYMLALFLGRKREWLNSLSIAGIIILIWNPAALFELSFGLSFTAVISIGYVLEQQSKHFEDREPFLPFRNGTRLSASADGQTIRQGGMRKLYEKLKASLLLTAAAVLGTAPLSIAAFHRFPLIAPAANLVVTPLVCFAVLPLGFVSGFTALLSGMQTMPFSTPIELLTRFTLLLVRFFSNVPYANVPVHSPPPALIPAYYLTWILCLKWKYRWRFIPVTVIIILYLAIPFLSNPGLRITFLDVGQGDAAVVEFPDNTVMLIDGGPEDGKAGQYAVAPELWSRGISSIDYLVVSHAHPDHIGGLSYIIKNFQIGQVWTTEASIRARQEFFYLATERAIAVRTPGRGDCIDGKGYRVYILHPCDEYSSASPRGDFSHENNDSLVLKIEAEGISVLFTGDIEEEAEQRLCSLGKWTESSIIKVPHHGGRTSSTDAFLKAVNPGTAIVSAGKNNPFHHPHYESLQRYKEHNVLVFRTDRDGAITITGKAGSYDVSTYEDSRFQKVKGLQDEIHNIRLLFISGLYSL